MMRILTLILVATGIGSVGISTNPATMVAPETVAPVALVNGISHERGPEDAEDGEVVLPVTITPYNPWYKSYGTFVDDGRFYGYHVGDDIETDELRATGVTEVPVYAVADGTVTFVDWVSGYGGVLVIAHDIGGETVSALYGHIDRASATVAVGDRVLNGEQIAILGEHMTEETDHRRMHLHFSLWYGDEIKIPGYVDTEEEIAAWIDPEVFLAEHGAL